MDIELAKKIATKAVTKAGKIVADYFNKDKNISFKGPRDIVTEVDLKSEKIIIDLITKNFPEHSILSEEAGFIDKKSDYLWMMDPIDGTVNYSRGIDPFCVALCLLEKGRPLISAIYMPHLGQFFFAAKGEGATLNGKKIKVSDNDLENSIAVFDISSRPENQALLMPHLKSVISSGVRMRAWSSSLSTMSFIANGSVDAYFSFSNKIWDFMPAVLLVQEAGGKVTDTNGRGLTLESTTVLATNGKVHAKMLELLKGV